MLSKAVTGELPSYPEDDPDALADETAAVDAEHFARIHVSSAAPNTAERHGFVNAKSRLAARSADSLFVFVRVDAAPRQLTVQFEALDATLPVLTWGDPAAGANRWARCW